MEENKSLIKKEEPPILLPTARALFKSGLFPQTKNEFGAYAIIEYGFELGIPPMTALQTMAMISGKICMAGQMMLSIALRNGLEYKILKDSVEECQVHLKFKNNEYTSSFTIAEAKQAGVYRQDSGWTKYPKDMLFWRAITRGLRRVCPDLILGLYAKEELEGAPPLNEAIDVTLDQPEQDEKPPIQKEEPPKTDTQKVTTQILNVTMKDGKNKQGKPYTIYFITGEVEEKETKFQTFSKTFAEMAKKTIGTSQLFEIQFKPTQWGNDLVSMTEPEDENVQ